MSTGNLKAKFEQEIKGATPKDTDTLRENICKRGSIPTIGAAPTAKGALGQNPENGPVTVSSMPLFNPGRGWPATDTKPPAAPRPRLASTT